MIYNKYKALVLQGGINAETDTLKVMLLTDLYTPNIDTDMFISDISANEISGTGYISGGQIITGVVVTQDNTNDLAKLDGGDIVWTNATFTARYAVIYQDTGIPNESSLMAYIDFGSNREVAGEDFSISWNADGIINAI